MAVPTQHWLFQTLEGSNAYRVPLSYHSRLGVHSRRLPVVPIGIISATIFAHTDQVDIQGKPTLFQVFCGFQLAATRSSKMRLTVVQDHRVKLFQPEIPPPFSQTQTELNRLCPETALAGVPMSSSCWTLRAQVCSLKGCRQHHFFLEYLHMAPPTFQVLSARRSSLAGSWILLRLCLFLYTNFHQP